MDTTATLRKPNPRNHKRMVSAFILALGLAAIVAVAVISAGESRPAGSDARGAVLSNPQPALEQPAFAPIPAPPDALDGPSAPLPVHTGGARAEALSYQEQHFLDLNLYLPSNAPVIGTYSPLLEENRWGEDFRFETGTPAPSAGPYTRGFY
jgi:hypothetical protein